ncbi:hypothetical protein PSCLAVI8L_220095 [Pseudoclavibacter sp. 8L]|nr:hypothetical protein PSCLAVI8L_220095 [Pseudoclavibacter sp. 8L]
MPRGRLRRQLPPAESCGLVHLLSTATAPSHNAVHLPAHADHRGPDRTPRSAHPAPPKSCGQTLLASTATAPSHNAAHGPPRPGTRPAHPALLRTLRYCAPCAAAELWGNAPHKHRNRTKPQRCARPAPARHTPTDTHPTAHRNQLAPQRTAADNALHILRPCAPGTIAELWQSAPRLLRNRIKPQQFARPGASRRVPARARRRRRPQEGSTIERV